MIGFTRSWMGLIAVLLSSGSCSVAAQPAGLTLEPVTIAGTTMQLPRGWQRQQDDYALVLTESNRDTAPSLALIAVRLPPGAQLAPAQVADEVLSNLSLAARGMRSERIEERRLESALYRLHRLDHRDYRAYLASFTYIDGRSGSMLHMMFSATEDRFVELGGPVLPLVVFGALPTTALAASAAVPEPPAASAGDCGDGSQSLEVCLAERWFGPGGQYATGTISAPYLDACQQRQRSARTPAERDAASAYCNQVYRMASRISAMNHQTTMSIAHNIGGGWCYRGEADCY